MLPNVTAQADVQPPVLSEKQKRLLECFMATGSLTRAQRSAKVSRQSHWRWMEEPAYAQAFAKAEKQSARALTDTAVKLAHEGMRKAVRYKGRVVGFETVYEPSLLMFLLRGLEPEKYRDRVDNRISNPDGSLRGAFDRIIANDLANSEAEF